MKSIVAFFVLHAAMAFGQDAPALVNISTLTTLTTDTFTIGFVVQSPKVGSTTPRRVLIRAVGASLKPFGITSLVDGLTITTSDLKTIVANLRTNSSAIAEAESLVGAFSRQVASTTGDAAILADVPPGSFTVSISATKPGMVIIEAYQLPVTETTPSAPANLVVIRAIGAGITLDWDDVSFPGFSRYGIYRGTTVNPKDATLLGYNSASTFTDGGLPSGVRYYYWVTGIALGNREGPKSNITSGVANAGI
jgi:hypothetical protein